MAQRTIVQFIDDIDGSQADQSITFGLDGLTYEIDLSETNAARLREAMSPWVQAGRRTGKSRSGSARRSSTNTTPTRAAELVGIRAWARAQGHAVSDRGRVPYAIEKQYWAAQTG